MTSRWMALVSIDSGRPSAQPGKMAVGGRELGAPDRDFLRQQPARQRDVAGRKDVERQPHVVHDAARGTRLISPAPSRENG